MAHQDAGGGASDGGENAGPDDEHARTMAFAEKAMERIKALRLPATPRNFEIWYAYATGQYPSLNQFIDDLLARRITVGGSMLEQIGARFVSAGSIKERIEALGTRVASEIDQIIDAIETTIVASGTQAEELALLDDRLAAAPDRDTLHKIVENMVVAAIETKRDRRRLEAQLSSAISEIAQVKNEIQAARNASLRDPVTGLANRQSFEKTLDTVMAATRDRTLTLVKCDIDHFEEFNNTWGHVTGDQVLNLVAAELNQQAPDRDMVARVDAGTFAVILCDTPERTAYDIADQIRRAIMSRDIRKRSTGQTFGRVTVSFGIASAYAGDTPGSLAGRAYACLRAAKDNGRNRVICQSDPEFAAAGRADAA